MPRATIAAALLASSLVALPAQADPRLVERFYNESEVVTINGRVNVQSTIQFGDDEAIENVAIGNSQSWQVTPNRRANLLFVKPLEPRAATNMTVVTNKRTYLFDLVASPTTRTPVYVLKFTYPVEETPEQTQLADGAPRDPSRMPNALEVAAAHDQLAVVDPAALNFDWTSDGVERLLPEQVYDDGTATFLAWPSGAPMPAILVKDRDGMEGPVNFAVRGDTVVLDGVPREIILRSGDDVATLINTGSNAPAPGA
ncbi:type VI secretion protein [Aurantiacibacter xanthus]|uniref:Type VI secretion protein n=2 Tax=Aurantiacibacter xanthus TaxID=1784712 RepID=A0A3A1P5G2_9SPHN|nr:type VI secretion protein [Aurantiacibacter xanthus]